MAKINLTIAGLKEAKQDLADLNKEFEKVKNDPIESKKIAKQFNNLQKEIDETTESLIDLNSAGQLVGTKFDDLNEVLFDTQEEILPLTGQIGEMEDRMYQLAQAGDTTSDEFVALRTETARLRTVIRETDKQVDLLAENKGLAVFGTGLRQIGDSVLRLDFETASRDAQALNASVGSLSKIGGSAIKGFTKTVGQLSKAFIKMGVALLANPIFLIATAVIALIAVLAKVMDSLGFLQPMLDAIGYTFGLIGDAIGWVVQQIKDFLDWMGLTNFAQQELARENDKLIDKMRDNLDKKGKAFDDNINQEIRLANIQGENTTKLELKKQEELIKRQRLEKLLLEEKIKQAKITGDLDEEELAKLKEQVQATKDVIQTARNDYEAINAQADADRLKNQQEAYKRQLEAQKKFNADRLNAERQIQDLQLSLQEEGTQKEIDANNLKYERLLEDTLKNENLNEEERQTLLDLLRQQQEAKNIEIYTKEEDARQARQAKTEADLKAFREKQFAEEEKANAEARAKREEADKKELENAQALADAKLNIVTQSLELTSALTELFANQSERSARIAFNVQKVASISSATLAGIQGAVNAYTTASASPISIYFPAYPAIQAGLAGAFASVNIAKIASTQFGASSGGGGNVATGTGAGATSTQQASPSFELFGQNNDANNLSEAQDVEQTIQVEAVVSETEVTSTQNKIKKIQENATL